MTFPAPGAPEGVHRARSGPERFGEGVVEWKERFLNSTCDVPKTGC